MTMQRSRFRSFSQGLLMRLLLLALIAMLLASITQVFLISRDVASEQDALVNKLAATQIPLLQSALWDIELATLQRQLERILDLPDVTSVYLQSETGLDVSAGLPVSGERMASTRLLIHSPVDS